MSRLHVTEMLLSYVLYEDKFLSQLRITKTTNIVICYFIYPGVYNY